VRRRHFITLLGGAAAAWPLAARAQQAGRTYRLGVLHNQGPQSPQLTSFYDELRRLGFVEGQNLIWIVADMRCAPSIFPPWQLSWSKRKSTPSWLVEPPPHGPHRQPHVRSLSSR
jgi:hypothetical protein